MFVVFDDVFLRVLVVVGYLGEGGVGAVGCSDEFARVVIAYEEDYDSRVGFL